MSAIGGKADVHELPSECLLIARSGHWAALQFYMDGSGSAQPFSWAAGIVRLTGLEMADRKRSRLSRGELTPFSERGNAVLFEDIAGALSQTGVRQWI